MKNNILLLFLGTLLYSCTNNTPEIYETDLPSSNVIYLSRIDTSAIVDIKKAEYVSASFQRRNSLTRGTALCKREIKGIETLKDENGRNLLYIVNYKKNQGFVIISATKNYMPILAFGDYGNFNIEEVEQSGASLWLKKQKEIIDSVDELPDSTKLLFRHQWVDYDIRKEANIVTRNYQDVISLMHDSINKWEQKGYSVFRYADIRDTQFFKDMPMEVQTEVHNAVDSADPRYGGRDYVTFILTKRKSKADFLSPLLNTHWTQQNGFNQYTPNNYPVGCVAVAMGQIMRYHEYPKRYSWELMHNDYATSTTAEFLYEIGKNTNMEYSEEGSSSNIDNALAAFKGYYGYSDARKINHSTDVVFDELRKKRPVYMRGYDSSGFLGIKRKWHAWVCDGYYTSVSCDEYMIFILEDTYDGSEPTEISYIYSMDGPIQTASATLHMNWGWNKHDGYFSDNNLWIHDEQEGDLNFAHGRSDIINLRPAY